MIQLEEELNSKDIEIENLKTKFKEYEEDNRHLIRYVDDLKWEIDIKSDESFDINSKLKEREEELWSLH